MQSNILCQVCQTAKEKGTNAFALVEITFELYGNNFTVQFKMSSKTYANSMSKMHQTHKYIYMNTKELKKRKMMMKMMTMIMMTIMITNDDGKNQPKYFRTN